MIKLKANLLFVVLLCTSINFLSASSSSTYSDALNDAKSQGKNVFVKYTADWCLPCQIFQESVLDNEDVDQFLNDGFVLYEADFDDPNNNSLIESNNILCLPTLHITNSEGSVLLELNGNLTKTAFLEALSPFAKLNHERLVLNDGQKFVKEDNSLSHNKVVEFESPSHFYIVQVGAFSSFENAVAMKNKVSSVVSEDAMIIHNTERNLYLVHLGKYFQASEFSEIISNLKKTNIEYFIKSKKI